MTPPGPRRSKTGRQGRLEDGATKPRGHGLTKAEIDRMASAFEHDDLKAALAAPAKGVSCRDRTQLKC